MMIPVTVLLRVGNSEVLNEVATVHVEGEIHPLPGNPRPDGAAPEAVEVAHVDMGDILRQVLAVYAVGDTGKVLPHTGFEEARRGE